MKNRYAKFHLGWARGLGQKSDAIYTLQCNILSTLSSFSIPRFLKDHVLKAENETIKAVR